MTHSSDSAAAPVGRSATLADLDPNTPVLVGVGQCAERIDDLDYAGLSPAQLAAAAARAALADAAGVSDEGADAAHRGVATDPQQLVTALAEGLDVVAAVRLFEDSGLERRTPLGRAVNLPRAVARAVGARPTRAVLDIGGGQSPQHLVTEFATEIAEGRARAALIVGAEALSSVRHWERKVRDWAASHPGSVPPDLPDWDDDTDGPLEDRGAGLEDLTSPDKIAVGLTGAPAAYALCEQARRERLRAGREDYARAMGDLFAPFTQVAADNPLAAVRQERTADELTTITERNRLIADPYPRFLVARDQVNQGAAVLLTSLGFARRLGLDPARFVFLHGHADTAERALLRRADLSQSPAAMAALQLALDIAQITADELTTIDLYSCFPIAVTNAADGIGLAHDDPRGLTVTGGLPFFGGPGNNYSLHAIAETVVRLRAAAAGRGAAIGAEGDGATAPAYGLVSANGGIMSKTSVGVYSTAPAAWDPGRSLKLQAELDGFATPPATRTPTDPTWILSYTVVPGADGAPRGIVVGETYDGERFLARAAEDAATRDLLAGDAIGAQVHVELDEFGVATVHAPDGDMASSAGV